jgi:hypothetical protein
MFSRTEIDALVNDARPAARRRAGLTTSFVLIAALSLGLSSLATAERRPPGSDVRFDASKALDTATGYMDGIDKAVAEATAAYNQLQAEGRMAAQETSKNSMKMLAGLTAAAKRAYATLQSAIARKDLQRAEREFVKLTVAYQRILDVAARVRASAGTTTTETEDGSPDLDVLMDADLPTSDPTEDLGLIDTLNVDTARPTSGSPFGT